MRTLIKEMLLAVGLSFATVPVILAAPIGTNVRGAIEAGTAIENVQFFRGRCERLRRACEFKDARGQTGEGNCRRYRAECGNERVDYCERLRRACEFKDARGQTGEGNCRRYRTECGRR